MIKSLWAMVQGNPRFMMHVNGWLTVLWIVAVPVSWAAGWLDSVVYVSALSLWALVSGHLAAWQAARVEVNQYDDDNVADVRQELQEIKAELQQVRRELGQ